MSEALTLEKVREKEIEEFQGTIFRDMQSRTQPTEVRINGSEYTIFPGVFNPAVAKAALFFAENIRAREGDVVLDPFSGCGVDAIEAVRRGAKLAIALDKDEMSVLNTQYNSLTKVHGGVRSFLRDIRTCKDISDIYHSGVDLIVGNPPFRDRGHFGDTMCDPSYVTLDAFFKLADKTLKSNGRIKMVFSDVGDVARMEDMAEGHGFVHDIVAETTYGSTIGIYVYHMERKK